MYRLSALTLALLFAACSAGSQSGKTAASADGDFKSWGSDSNEPSAKGGDAKGEDKDEEPPTFKDPKQEKLPSGPSCLDTKGDVQECLHDSDCCKGFYCGLDPAGSQRIKVCLYGGK